MTLNTILLIAFDAISESQNIFNLTNKELRRSIRPLTLPLLKSVERGKSKVFKTAFLPQNIRHLSISVKFHRPFCRLEILGLIIHMILFMY